MSTAPFNTAPNNMLVAGGGRATLVSEDGYSPTYLAAATGVTLYSTAAAVLTEIQGSATKLIRVKRITIWAQAGTKFFTELQLLRSTTIGGGTPTALTPQPFDITLDPAATAVVNTYAAASAYGTGHLVMGARCLPIMAPAATNSMTPAIWNFCTNQDKALILRGTSDVIQVYNTITGLGTATFGCEWEFEEYPNGSF